MPQVKAPKVTSKRQEKIAEDLGYTADQLATAIMTIDEAMKQFERSKLEEKALLVLLSHHSHIPQVTIKKILESLRMLKIAYLK